MILNSWMTSINHQETTLSAFYEVETIKIVAPTMLFLTAHLAGVAFCGGENGKAPGPQGPGSLAFFFWPKRYGGFQGLMGILKLAGW